MTRSNMDIQTVVGSGNSFQTSLTITTGTYAAGAVVGGAMTVPASLSNGGRGYVYSVKLAGQTTANPYELWFFNDDLVTPAANGAALALVAADAPKFQGSIDISGSDYRSPSSGFQSATVRSGLVVDTTANTPNVIAYLKNVGASTGGVSALSVIIDVDYMD